MNFDFARSLSYSICAHIAFIGFCLIGGFYYSKFRKISFTEAPITVSTISLKDYNSLQKNKISSKTQIVQSPDSNKKTDPQEPQQIKSPTAVRKSPAINTVNQKATLAPHNQQDAQATQPPNASGLEVTQEIPRKPEIAPKKETDQVLQKDEPDQEAMKVAPASNKNEIEGASQELKSDDILNINTSAKNKAPAAESSSLTENNDESSADAVSPNNPEPKDSPKTTKNEAGANETSLKELFSSNTDLLKGDSNTISIQHFITLKFMKCWEKYSNSSKMVAKIEVDLEAQFAQDGTVMSIEEKEPYIQTAEEQVLYKEMLDNAKSCIYECSPITDAPLSKYNEWRIVRFHFHNNTV